MGAGDFLPPTPVERGGDGDARPVRGEIFCRLLEGTGEEDLTADGMRFGGMLANFFQQNHVPSIKLYGSFCLSIGKNSNFLAME